MCGIVGILERWEPASPDSIYPMVEAIAHRGPDGRGVYTRGNMALGHCRLAIVDRTDAAAQPYLSTDQRYVLVFNGEIYNAPELRSHLLHRDIRFRSKSDTEVLLNWLQYRGIEGVRDLDGMFAFALWDTQAQTLLCCRDPMGIKPLFYWHGNERFVFASEIGAILAVPGVPRQPDWVALRHYFSLNYVLAPHTGILAIRQLPPGSWLEITSAGELAQQTYWKPQFHPVSMSRRDAALGLEAVMRHSVARQLQSDVPVALWLSGGVDSAGIGAWWRESYSEPIVAYSAGFAETSFDETDSAKKTAAALNLELRRVTITPADVIRWMDDIRHWLEPMADSSGIAVAALARETRREHTVVLSGEGADELLGGYITYNAIHLAALWQQIPRPFRDRISRIVLAGLPVRYQKVGWDEQLRRFFATQNESLPNMFARWRQILSDDLLAMLTKGSSLGQQLVGLDPPWSLWNETFRSQPGRLHGAMLSDLTTSLPNDLLVKVDRASMRYGIEARVPYLGKAVVDFCLSLPEDHIQPLGLGRKVVLRQILKNKVPDGVLWGKKRGFNVPINQWFRGPLREWLSDELSDVRTRSHPLLCPTTVARLYHEHLDGRADHGYTLFGLVLFLRWWRYVF